MSEIMDDTRVMRHSDLQRLDRLEGVIDLLSQNQARLESSVENLAKSVEKVGGSVEQLSTRVSERAQTNWGTVIATGGLLAVIVGGAFAMMNGYFGIPINHLTDITNRAAIVEERQFMQVSSELKRLERKQEQIEVRLSKDLKARDAALDDMVQREMRLLDDIVQREMRLLDNEQATRINNLEDRVSSHDDKLSMTSEKVEGLNERTRALEREIFKRNGETQ